MTNGNNHHDISLAEAATTFLTGLPPGDREASQQEVNRFIRWYGAERPLGAMTAHEIENYPEQLSPSDKDYVRKLEMVRAFLAHAKKKGWTSTNLGVHLKSRKKGGVPAVSRRALPETISLTQEGYSGMKCELATLKGQRHEAIDEMRKAAADKDFRENAPLHAARERRGHLEGRIKELEETLKLATVISGDQTSNKANIGDSVVVCDITSGEELRYMIVNPKETDPLKGKISSQSPIGKAIVGHREGDEVEVTAPAGKLRYRIQRVKH